MARFILVPQWQGSGSPRAMSLIDGVDAIEQDLPRTSTTRIDIPLEAGEAIGTGVHRASALIRIRREVREALRAIESDSRVVLIGGDCGVAPLAIDDTVDRLGAADLAVVWFDAHADFNDPDTSPSGAYGGMALTSVVGEGVSDLRVEVPIAPSRIVLVGTRDVDDAEWGRLHDRGITTIGAAETTAESVTDAVSDTGATRVHVHVDLDVIDPASMTGVSSPQPFGVSARALVDSIRAIGTTAEIVSASIAGFAPASPADAVNDLGTILRVVGALAR